MGIDVWVRRDADRAEVATVTRDARRLQRRSAAGSRQQSLRAEASPIASSCDDRRSAATLRPADRPRRTLEIDLDCIADRGCRAAVGDVRRPPDLPVWHTRHRAARSPAWRRSSRSRSSAGRKRKPAMRAQSAARNAYRGFCAARSNARVATLAVVVRRDRAEMLLGSRRPSRPGKCCDCPTCARCAPTPTERDSCGSAYLSASAPDRSGRWSRTISIGSSRTRPRSYAFPWTRGVFSDCLKSRHECWVAVRENDLIGHGVLSIGANEAPSAEHVRRRDHQGNGSGADRRAHDRSRGAPGASVVYPRGAAFEPRAGALYASLGFREIGSAASYYPAEFGNEDAQLHGVVARTNRCADRDVAFPPTPIIARFFVKSPRETAPDRAAARRRSRSSRTRTPARPRSPRSCCCSAARSSSPARSRRASPIATRRPTGWRWSGARHLGHDVGDAVRLRGLHASTCSTRRATRLLRGHVPHADRGRLRGDGDRRARRASRRRRIKLFEVCRLRDTPILTFVNKLDREMREPIELLDEIEDVLRHRVRADDLADRHAAAVSRRLRPRARQRSTATTPGTATTCTRIEHDRRARRARSATTVLGGDDAELVRRRSSWCAAPATPFDHERYLAGNAHAGVLRHGAQQLRRARTARRLRRARAAAAAARGARARRRTRRTRRSPASCSRSRRTWIRSIATASRSCASARAASREACRCATCGIGKDMKVVRRDHVHGRRARYTPKRRSPATSSACTTTARSRSATRSPKAKRCASPASRTSRRSSFAACASRSAEDQAARERARSARRGRRDAGVQAARRATS